LKRVWARWRRRTRTRRFEQIRRVWTYGRVRWDELVRERPQRGVREDGNAANLSATF
jgi:hypothetical protein